MVRVLPFDKKLGYPQRQRVKIGDKAYNIYYRWNSNGFAVLRIRRGDDGKLLYEGKVVRLNPVEVKDEYHSTLFVLLPWKVDEQNCEIWVFW